MKIITGYDIIDKYTLKLNLSGFDLNLLYNLTMGAGLISSPTAAKKTTTPEYLAIDHMVGTGAFNLVSTRINANVAYRKAENYRESDKPYLDGIEFTQISDPASSMTALRSGKWHLIYDITPQQATELKAAGFNITTEGTHSVVYITPDGANPDSPFGDKMIREAVEYAIDKAALADGEGLGYYPELTQFAMPGDATYNWDMTTREYNPTRARQLLTKAGFPIGFYTRILA
jgi:ABC-type transport system substrate-binding protein